MCRKYTEVYDISKKNKTGVGDTCEVVFVYI